MKKEVLFSGITAVALTPAIAFGGQIEQNLVENPPTMAEHQIFLNTPLPSEEEFQQNFKIQQPNKEENFLNHPNDWQKAAVTVGVLGFAILMSSLTRKEETRGATKSEVAGHRLGWALIYTGIGLGLYTLWR